MPFLPLLIAASMVGPDISVSPAAATVGATSAVSATQVAPTESPTPQKTDLKEIGNIVVTADRHPQPLAKTVKPTYIVTRQQIENYGYDTIAEAIQSVPGEHLSQYGAFGSQAGYSSMGALGNGTTLLIDGMPIASGSQGTVDIGMLSTLDVERIEVVEAGGSVLYGSGASGGIINIITSVPSEKYLSVSDGAFNDRKIKVEDGNGTIGLSYERHIATNDYPYSAQVGNPAGIRANDEALQSEAVLSYNKEIGRYTIKAHTSANQLDVGVPGAVNFPSPSDAMGTTRYDFQTDISRVDGKYTSSAAFLFTRADGIYNSVSLGGGNSLVDSRSGVSLKEVVVQHGNSSLVSGIDLYRETSLNVFVPGSSPNAFASGQSQSAVYALQTLGLGPDGKVYGGLRAEHDSPAGSVLDPEVGILVPWGKMRISANAGESFIVPTLVQLYYPGFSNPALLPERDQNKELTFTLPTKRVTPTLSVFDRTATNLIAYNSAFVPLNAGRGHFQGATFNVSSTLLHGFDTSFNITNLWEASSTQQGVTSRLDYEPLFEGSASIEHALGASRFTYGTTIHFAGGHTESYTGPGEYGAYTKDDLYVRYHLADKSIISFHENNIGNNTNGLYGNYPVPGHQFRIEYSTR
jgi:vitamin B12 transporter